MKIPMLVAGGVLAAAALAAAVRAHGAPHDAALQNVAIRDAAPQNVALREQGLAVPRPAAPARVVVYVAGAVHHAGVYTLGAGARVDAALRAASGPTADADMLAVNLAEPLQDGEKVLVPPKGASGDPAYAAAAAPAGGYAYTPRRRRGHAASSSSYGPSASGSRRSSRSHRQHKEPPSAPVDINAADATALEQLPGIGAGLAERIVAFREANGAFHTPDDLLDVAGMTDRRYEEIVPYVVVR
jgi:competence protein ComEA